MTNHDKDLEQLVNTLMGSACTWTASKIYNQANRFAYVRAVSRCAYECRDKSVDDMKTALLKLRRNTPGTFMRRWELFSNVKRYYMLGIEMSLEVVESINVRFEKGHSHEDERFVRNILERIEDAR